MRSTPPRHPSQLYEALLEGVVLFGILAVAIWKFRLLAKPGYVTGLFLLGYLGLAVSLFPYIIPHAVTIWDAAAPPSSMIFILVGVVILVPLILGYTAWTYWIFRGKVTVAAGYGAH